VILSLTAYEDYELEQLDVKTAFLNGNLEETIYMRQPPGFEEGTGNKYEIEYTKRLLRKEFDMKELGLARKILGMEIVMDRGKRIAMVPSKATPQLPNPKVKVKEKIVKAKVVDEHVDKIQELQNYALILRMIIKNQMKFSMVNNEASFIIIESLVAVDREHTTRCFRSWTDHWKYGRRVKKYESFRVDVKRKSIEDKVRREVFDVVEALDIENLRASSFQIRRIHVVKTKVNAVRDWYSPKTLPEVRNNKVANVFQKEDELEYAEPLDEEAKQVTYEKICYMIIDGESSENLVSKALVKAFKLLTEPYPSPYQIGRTKKGLTLKVTEICKVPLAMGKHYNELVVCDVVDMETCHNKTLATLVALPKDFQAEKKETGVSYALVMKGVNDVMENARPTVIKPLVAEFGLIVTDDTLDALPPMTNIQHQIDLSRKTTLLVPISSETSLKSQLVKEIHAKGLSALGRDKTIASVESRFSWPQLKRDVGAFVKRCVVCQEGNGKAQTTSLYMPLPLPES
nr:transposon Ty3-I Gag-Pol polyprotein [Tanacetum cinerariifolium]